MLAKTFASESLAKLQALRLLRAEGAGSATSVLATLQVEAAATESQSAPEALASSPRAGAVSPPPCLEEHLVRLTDIAPSVGRKPALKDPPTSLAGLSSEEEIGRYSLEALKKLAKSSSLELPKQASKSAVVALLTDAWRGQQARFNAQAQAERAEGASSAAAPSPSFR